MIVETVGRLLYSLVPSLSGALMLAGPVLLLAGLLYHLWPMVATFYRRIRQVDDLPGPRCTSVILGNVPAEMLKSLITGADHKKLIISKWQLSPAIAHG